MRKVLLNFKPDQSVEQIHEYLKFELEFDDYYGKNLDALYDQLTCMAEDTCLGVFGLSGGDEKHSLYLEKVKKVLKDAELDNPCLCVIFGNIEENYGDV